MNILIADDSTLIRSNLIKLIGPSENEVHFLEAVDVESTLEKLDSLSVDLLVLDIQFPDGSGFEVLEHLKNRQKKPYVMVLTNYSSQARKNKSLDLGADLFFDKTDEYEKVVEVIREHIAK